MATLSQTSPKIEHFHSNELKRPKEIIKHQKFAIAHSAYLTSMSCTTNRLPSRGGNENVSMFSPIFPQILVILCCDVLAHFFSILVMLNCCQSHASGTVKLTNQVFSKLIHQFLRVRDVIADFFSNSYYAIFLSLTESVSISFSVPCFKDGQVYYLVFSRLIP